MRTASEIIEALGGTVKVALALGLTPSTVSSWKSAKGGIPRWWSREIERLEAEKSAVAAEVPAKADAA